MPDMIEVRGEFFDPRHRHAAIRQDPIEFRHHLRLRDDGQIGERSIVREIRVEIPVERTVCPRMADERLPSVFLHPDKLLP